MEKAALVREAILDLPKLGVRRLQGITEDEYDIVKLAVINSIKGEIIAHEEKSRQSWVEEIFLAPAKADGLLSYEDLSGTEKCDFEGDLLDYDEHFGLEVKGGEGNSVTLLHRPPSADTFVVWSILDVMSNTPAQNMRAVLGRIVKQMVNDNDRKQLVDCLVFYDDWYVSGMKAFTNGEPLPDAVVLPSATPTKANPHPPPQNPSDLNFLRLLYEVVGGKEDIENPSVKRHIWICDLEIEQRGNSWYRSMTVKNWFDPSATLTRQEFTSARIKPIDAL